MSPEALERERLLAELQAVVTEREALRKERARLEAELARARAAGAHKEPNLISSRRRKAGR